MTDTIEKTPTQEQPKLTEQIVKAKFLLAIDATVFQKTLANVSSYKVTEENVLDAKEKVATARKLLTKIETEKKVLKAPALAECDYWENAFKGTHGALKPHIDRIAGEVGAIGQKRAAEAKIIADEKAKQEAEEKEATDYFLKVAERVAAATTADQIVSIEKQIGAHSQKPLYKEKAENLKPIIAKQKEHIRALEALKEAEKKAEQSGDDEKIMQIRKKQQSVEALKAENTDNVQMAAIKTAETSSAIFPEVVGVATVKPSRTLIKWQVTDINELYKKRPELVNLVPNKEAIDLLLSKHREKLAEKKEKFVEINFNGVRFYADEKW